MIMRKKKKIVDFCFVENECFSNKRFECVMAVLFKTS